MHATSARKGSARSRRTCRQASAAVDIMIAEAETLASAISASAAAPSAGPPAATIQRVGSAEPKRSAANRPAHDTTPIPTPRVSTCG